MKGVLGAQAVCPFYIKDGKTDKYGDIFIICEGVCKSNFIQMNFKKSDEFKAFTTKFCCGNYHNCLVAKMLNEKYENT